MDNISVTEILTAWENCYEAHQAHQQLLLQQLLKNYESIRHQAQHPFSFLDFPAILQWHEAFLQDERQHQQDGHNFNWFELMEDVMNQTFCETMHSHLLAFLLDSHSSHGQGNKFLIEFLKLLHIQHPEQGRWNISREKGKIDILVHREEPESVIIIENKSNGARDQPHQLYRYWYHVIYSKTKSAQPDFYQSHSDQYQILYLIPKSWKYPEEQSITRSSDLQEPLPERLPMKIQILTYDYFIQEWLDRCLQVLPPENRRIREYILQYQMKCKNL